MELTAELKMFLGETAATLKESARRLFMARAAIAPYERALQLLPATAPSRIDIAGKLAVAYMDGKNYGQAAAYAQRVLRLRPDDGAMAQLYATALAQATKAGRGQHRTH